MYVCICRYMYIYICVYFCLYIYICRGGPDEKTWQELDVLLHRLRGLTRELQMKRSALIGRAEILRERLRRNNDKEIFGQVPEFLLRTWFSIRGGPIYIYIYICI